MATERYNFQELARAYGVQDGGVSLHRMLTTVDDLLGSQPLIHLVKDGMPTGDPGRGNNGQRNIETIGEVALPDSFLDRLRSETVFLHQILERGEGGIPKGSYDFDQVPPDIIGLYLLNRDPKLLASRAERTEPRVGKLTSELILEADPSIIQYRLVPRGFRQ